MYHSVIGKRLVDAVNKRDQTSHTVREFFDDVYVPLFFGSARLLQNVNNSPFDQAVTKQKRPVTQDLVKACLAAVHGKAQSQERDASFYLGGPASGSLETTSGQVTAMHVSIPEEDIYASWIGAALGLTVQGGMTLLIDSEDVLLATYDGWAKYRRHLDQMPNLKSLQINTWNGQWVANQMAGEPESAFRPTPNAEGTALETQPWVQLLFALSYHYRKRPERRLLSYVYSLGQSNTTLGFVQLNLPEVKRVVDVYNQLFTVPAGMPSASFLNLYQTDESFKFACSRTEIGLRALKPKDVFQAQKGVPKMPSQTEPKKRVAFYTYQSWIIAMLKNKELITRAEELAAALNRFHMKAERAKSVHANLINGLLEKKTRRDFVEELTKLLQEDTSEHEIFERVVEDLLSLSNDNVPLFLTLLRFKYAIIKAKS